MREGRIRTNANKLKKLTSNASRHSSGVLSAILFTGARVPWLRIRASMVLKAVTARSTALGPNYSFKMSITKDATRHKSCTEIRTALEDGVKSRVGF